MVFFCCSSLFLVSSVSFSMYLRVIWILQLVWLWLLRLLFACSYKMLWMCAHSVCYFPHANTHTHAERERETHTYIREHIFIWRQILIDTNGAIDCEWVSGRENEKKSHFFFVIFIFRVFCSACVAFDPKQCLFNINTFPSIFRCSEMFRWKMKQKTHTQPYYLLLIWCAT